MQHYTIFFIIVNAAAASGSSKQAWHIPDAVCTVLDLLMMGGETPETRTALTIIKNIV